MVIMGKTALLLCHSEYPASPHRSSPPVSAGVEAPPVEHAPCGARSPAASPHGRTVSNIAQHCPTYIDYVNGRKLRLSHDITTF